MGPARSSRLHELARQVWYLPHIRRAVFEELVNDLSIGERRTVLQYYLTLDRATSLDIAALLYSETPLDRFPWDCPDEKRRRAYAAGVRVLDVTGSMPLCGQWDSFPDMLAFFPNAHRVFFGTGIEFKKDVLEDWDNVFFIEQLVSVGDDSSVSQPTPFFDIDDFSYRVLRSLEYGSGVSAHGRPFSISEDGGEAEVPEIFLTPLLRFEIDPIYDRHGDWLRILEFRKTIGYPTLDIKLNISFPQVHIVIPRLAHILPPSLQSLRLTIASLGAPHSILLDHVMKSIDEQHTPGLRQMMLRLLYLPDAKTDTNARDFRPPRPQWLENRLPLGLRVILDLVIGGHLEDEQSDDDSFAESMLASLPLLWIEDARRALAEVQGALYIRTFRLGDDEVAYDFEPPAVMAALWPTT